MNETPRATKWHPLNRTRDDRGHVVDLFRAHERAFEFGDENQLSKDEYASISMHISKKMPAYWLQSCAFPGCFLVACLASVPLTLIMLANQNWPMALNGMMTVVMGVIFWLTWRRTFVVGSRAAVKEALLSHSRCASCGYKLDGLREENDGCLVCTECGAAWKLSSIHSSNIDVVEPGRKSWKERMG